MFLYRSSVPVQFDDIVPPTEIVNIENYLNSMKPDDKTVRESNTTSQKANATNDAKTNVIPTLTKEEETNISKELSGKITRFKS